MLNALSEASALSSFAFSILSWSWMSTFPWWIPSNTVSAARQSLSSILLKFSVGKKPLLVNFTNYLELCKAQPMYWVTYHWGFIECGQSSCIAEICIVLFKGMRLSSCQTWCCDVRLPEHLGCQGTGKHRKSFWLGLLRCWLLFVAKLWISTFNRFPLPKQS